MPLANVDLTTTSNTLLYTVPGSDRAVCTVSLCNRNTSASTLVSLALTTGGAPATTDYIEYQTTLGANGVMERSGLVLAAGEKIYAQTSVTGVSAVVFGIVEVAS